MALHFEFRFILILKIFDNIDVSYSFSKLISFIVTHFSQRIRLHLYTFPSKLRLENYTFPWNHYLYFIPVFIYTFIKVKSKWGKEKKWLRHENGLSVFSFGCKYYKQSGRKAQSPTATPIKHKIPYSEPENIRESILDFAAHFGEINPDMPYLCRRGLSGSKKAVFAFFPSVRRESMKKNVKSSIFRKKQVNFWVVYLLRCNLLIINKNTILHR